MRAYKPLTNKTVPQVALDVENPDLVVFGTGVASDDSSQPFVFLWRLNDRTDGRITSSGTPVASVRPSLTVGGNYPLLKVELIVFPPPPEPLVAYLLLLGNKSRCMLKSSLSPYTIPTDLPVIDSQPSDQRDVLTDDTQTFKCTVSGSPRPIVTWYFNGDEQEGDSDDKNKLTLSPTTVEHSGMYHFFADNENGFTSASWTLQVREPGMYQYHCCLHA